MLLLSLSACWTASPAAQPPPTVSNAEIRAIRRCSPIGPQLLVLTVEQPRFEVEIEYKPGEPIPRVVVDGDRSKFSACYSHGCTIANLALDELAIGSRASGRYDIIANAGPTWSGRFEARWVGIPWTVECLPDPV